MKPNLSRPVSKKDRELEEELNRERYFALECDEIRVEEQEGGLYLELNAISDTNCMSF